MGHSIVAKVNCLPFCFSYLLKMITLSDFVNICRLCLAKHDDHSVKLFSKQNIGESKKDTRQFRVTEMVESFCNVKIRTTDGLPGSICSKCWNTVSAMQRLRIVSHRSDELLNEILISFSTGAVVKDEKEVDEITKFQIEFIDTQLNVKEEPLLESMTISELTPTNSKSTAESSRDTITTKNGVKKKIKKKIACEMCGKLVESNLIKYHLNTHEGKRPFKCEVEDCVKCFPSPYLMQQHFQKVHVLSTTRPLKCDICGKGFVQTSSLNTHRSYHFDPEIPCPICGQLYRNKRALQKHSLVHSGERAFPCTECPKSFQTSFTLKTHMRTHTNEKPFSCSDCSNAFSYKCLLKAHIQKHHPKESR